MARPAGRLETAAAPALLAALPALALLAALPVLLCGCGGPSSPAPTPAPPQCVPPTPAPTTDARTKVETITTVLVGSGGCDGQDAACKDNKTLEAMVVSLGVDGEGALVSQQRCWTVPGLPAWLAVRGPAGGARGCLFAVYPDTSSIGIFQLELDSLNGGTTAKMVSSVATKGVNPVFGDVALEGKYLVVADYHGPDDVKSSDGAGVESFAISADCGLKFVDFREHSGGSGKVPDRQAGAHPHSAVAWGPDLVFVCDLGADKIFSYRVEANGSLSVLSSVDTAAGFGPRHSVPHPTKPMLFVVGEMGCEVLTYNIDETTGTLTLASSVSTKPNTDPPSYGSKAAEVVISPDGLHVYASNRAFSPGFRHTVAVFRLMDGGVLEPIQQMDCPSFPRGMAMTPDGKALLVASQTDGSVVSYQVDPETGLLGEVISTQEGPLGAAAFAVLPELPAAPSELSV